MEHLSSVTAQGFSPIIPPSSWNLLWLGRSPEVGRRFVGTPGNLLDLQVYRWVNGSG